MALTFLKSAICAGRHDPMHSHTHICRRISTLIDSNLLPPRGLLKVSQREQKALGQNDAYIFEHIYVQISKWWL